jgi:voltage-gated potassium channel
MFFLEAQIGGRDSLSGPAFFLWSERIVAVLLTLEVVLRFILCSSVTKIGTDRQYFKSPEMVFDMIAILPFWAGFFVPVAYLEAVRSMRILRLLKFYRVSPIAHKVVGSLIAQRKKIRLVSFFAGIIVLFSGSVMHHLEDAVGGGFDSYWNSVWWSVVTLTTVGYGDMSPVTKPGQAVAMLLMIVGIGIMGALIGIFVEAFNVGSEEESQKT